VIRTRFTDLVGVRHPLVCGGMTGVGTAPLVAAVAESGALGFLTALTQPTPEALADEIARTRELTDQPFGVNLTILPTRVPVAYDEYRRVIVECGVRVVETAGSNPAPHLPELKEAGVTVIHKAVGIRHALKAQEAGVDVIAIDGFECAGHPGEDDVTSLVLVPLAVRALSVPVVACGGFATGSGLAAALALGADAVAMGTRFVATDEAPVHPNVKHQIVANNEFDTELIFREFRNTARVARNRISTEINRIAARDGAVFADVADLASGERGRRRVLAEGAMDEGLWWAGMSQALVRDVSPVAQVVATIVDEAEQILGHRLPALVTP